MRTFSRGAVVALTAIIVAAKAYSQEAPAAQPAAQSPSTALEEVVVTARKRATGESVQDIPLSMIAISGEEMKVSLANNLTDVGRSMPNVQFNTASQTGYQNFSIRGMGISGATASDEPAVGIFKDGVYLASNFAASLDPFDVESIAVLRGPQGTLFGRNVTGGAVAITDRRPSGDFGVNGELVYGNDGQADFSIGAEAPLVKDVLSGRLTVLDRNSDGYWNNLYTGHRRGAKDTLVVRPVLKFTPTEDVDVTLTWEEYRDRSDPEVLRATITPPLAPGYVPPDDFWDLLQNFEGENKIDVSFGALEVNWNAAGGLFTYIAGYRAVEADHSQDVDGTQFDLYVIRNISDQDQQSHELRYASTFSQRVDFTVGLYYSEAHHVADETRRVFGVSQIATRGRLDQESYAAFFDADFNLTDRWTVSVGGRYTDESKTAQTAPFGSCAFDFSSCLMGAPGDASWTNFSPRAALQYQFDPHKMAYASVTRGFRSGGFDQRGQPRRDPFEPEEVTAYEGGFKGDFLDGRLRTNVAIFHNEYTDLQRNVLFGSPTQGSFQATLNAADATMEGVELELTYLVNDALTLSGTYGYIDASYDKFDNFNPAGGSTPDPAAAKALDLPLTPDQTFSLAASYKLALGNAGDLTIRLADSYRASRWSDLANKLPLPSYSVVDASATFNAASGHWYTTLFAKNVTNEEYPTWAGPLGAIGIVHIQGPPAQYGIKLGFNF